MSLVVVGSEDLAFGALPWLHWHPVKGRIFYAIAHIIGCLLVGQSPTARELSGVRI